MNFSLYTRICNDPSQNAGAEMMRGIGSRSSRPPDVTSNLGAMRKRLPGVREVTCQDNRMIVDVLTEEFRIEVTGFDENRDVYVRVRPLERDQ